MTTADGRELDRLLDEIRDEVRATRHWTGRAALEPRVFEVLCAVPRHVFVPDELVFKRARSSTRAFLARLRWRSVFNPVLPIQIRAL